MSEGERKRAQEVIAFLLGIRRVELRTLAECPTISQSEFQREFKRSYDVQTPDCLSQPVSADLMTVLLVDNDGARARKLSGQMRAEGFEVDRAKSLAHALSRIRRSCRRIDQIVVWAELPGDREAALRELAAAAPQAILVDAIKMAQPELPCPRTANASSISPGVV
jgi:hypothetical protein